MENGELYRLITEQINKRLDRLEDTIQHYLDNQTVVCKDHDRRIDEHDTQLSVLEDRQAQNEKHQAKVWTGIGLSIPIVNAVFHFIWEKLKI